MAKDLDSQSMKTIEDLLQHEMIEKEAIVRLLIKKGIITPAELKAEIDLLSNKIQRRRA